MTSKYGALLKDETTKQAVYAVLQDIFEGHHVKCFEAFRSHFALRGDLEEMEIDFQTFLRTAREIFAEVGGEFSKDKLDQTIPGNKWMVFHENNIAKLLPELINNRQFIRRKKDHQKICADVIKKAIELETKDRFIIHNRFYTKILGEKNVERR